MVKFYHVGKTLPSLELSTDTSQLTVPDSVKTTNDSKQDTTAPSVTYAVRSWRTIALVDIV